MSLIDNYKIVITEIFEKSFRIANDSLNDSRDLISKEGYEELSKIESLSDLH
jgi:hypothetical protein